MPFRFLHTADIHLDSPLRSMALRDRHLADRVASATRDAFVRVIDICLEERVDALLIAGDLYDGQQTSMKTALFLGLQLQRLDQAGVRVFMIRGNHDALSKITKELVLPPNTHVFGAAAGAVEFRAPGLSRPVVVHGISFAQPRAPKSLLPSYRAPIPDAFNIGMMHTSLNGSPEHDPYAPCSVSDLDKSGFDYWALGHIHKRSIWQDKCTIVMPGNPQGRDIGEAGAKSATLVTVNDDGDLKVEQRMTALVQFERLAIDLGGLSDWEDVISAQATAIRNLRATHMAEHLVLRPTLSGETRLLPRLLRDSDLLLAEAQHASMAFGSVWIDKVELRAAEAAQAAPTSGALAGLADELTLRIHGSSGLQAEFGAEVAALIKALPRELRTLPSDALRDLPPALSALLGDSEAARNDAITQLAKDGSSEVLAQLAPAFREGN